MDLNNKMQSLQVYMGMMDHAILQKKIIPIND